MSTRAFIVIEAKDLESANALALSTFDPVGGGKTFTVGLVPAGSSEGAPFTHYITSSEFEDEKWALIPGLSVNFTGSYYEAYDLLLHPNRPWDYCTSVNLRRPVTKMP